MSKMLGLSPDLDERAFAAAEALVGEEIRLEPYNHEASRDTIRHYAEGIGDDNPLWCDPDYAAASPFGDLVAPPTFLYSSFDGAIGAGFVGVQPIYAGTRWVFERRILRDQVIVPRAVFGPMRRLSGRTASDMVIQTAQITYQVDGVTAATALASTFRVPRRDAGKGLAYEPREEHAYTNAELEAIRDAALNEVRQGATPLEVTSLRPGAPLPPVVKGPIDRITMTAYYAGCIGSPGYKACELAWKYRDYALNDPSRLPSNYDPSYFAEAVLPSIGHQDPDVAREIGMPNAYDNGPQRCGWFGHVVTNWMGDRGFLRELDVRLRRPDIFGDTVWVSGSVAAIKLTDDVARVELSLHATNQLDDAVAEGRALVLLPMQADGPPAESSV